MTSYNQHFVRIADFFRDSDCGFRTLFSIHTFVRCFLFGCWLGLVNESRGQAVSVTLRLENPIITVGSTTRLHVAAQILPALSTNADRIFSWYVDVRNLSGLVASPNYSALTKPAADNLVQFSSIGFTDGDNRRGIFDTFMNLPAAGKTAPVELLVIPVTGLIQGRTTLSVRPGSGVTGLSADFIVAPSAGGDPWLGGDYTAATAELLVINTNAQPRLHSIIVTNLSGGTNQVEMQFTPPAGFTCYVEFRDDLANTVDWQTLPGGPHTNGIVTDIGPFNRRFYRVRAVPDF